MLEPNDDGNLVDEKSVEFTDIYGENPEPIEHRLEMAKYTPSFFKDYWKYVVLTTMEIEYDWRYFEPNELAYYSAHCKSVSEVR